MHKYFKQYTYASLSTQFHSYQTIWLKEMAITKEAAGASGWLSQLSTRFRLTSWSHALWVQARHRAHCCQCGACFGSSVLLFFSLSSSLLLCSWSLSQKGINRGTCVAQPVKLPTLAQVMVSRFMSSSPASGSALTALSASPLLTLCLFLSAPPLLALSLSKINIKTFF